VFAMLEWAFAGLPPLEISTPVEKLVEKPGKL
jgi:hypothetical protein